MPDVTSPEVPDVEAADPAAAPAGSALASRPVWRRPVAWAAVAAVAGAASLAWWATHPSAYAEGGFGMTGPLPPPGTSLLVGLGVRPADGSVVLAEVVPVVTTNTAAATVEVFVCDRPRGDLPPGVVEATAAQYCGRAADVDGYVQSAIRGGAAGPTRGDLDGHVVVQITPTRPGTVAIGRTEVRYRDGLQRGTHTSATDLVFTSR